MMFQKYLKLLCKLLYFYHLAIQPGHKINLVRISDRGIITQRTCTLHTWFFEQHLRLGWERNWGQALQLGQSQSWKYSH